MRLVPFAVPKQSDVTTTNAIVDAFGSQPLLVAFANEDAEKLAAGIAHAVSPGVLPIQRQGRRPDHHRCARQTSRRSGMHREGQPGLKALESSSPRMGPIDDLNASEDASVIHEH